MNKKPSNTDLYRKNQVRISVLQQLSTGYHVFVKDGEARTFPTGKQYYDVAAEYGLNMKEPGFYAILNRFIDCGKERANNYEVCAVSRLPDERTARDLTGKLYNSEIARYESGPPNFEDPMFRKYCKVLFEGESPEILNSNKMPDIQETPEVSELTNIVSPPIGTVREWFVNGQKVRSITKELLYTFTTENGEQVSLRSKITNTEPMIL